MVFSTSTPTRLVGGLLCVRMYNRTHIVLEVGITLSAANHIISATTPNRRAGYELIIYYANFMWITLPSHSMRGLFNRQTMQYQMVKL